MTLPLGARLIQYIVPKYYLKTTYQIITFVLTFLCYAVYHISRKPISVVKSVLHKNCSRDYVPEIQWVDDNSTDCGWEPFDRKDWSELMGTLDVVYVFSYACGMFISGHIAERANVRLFLASGMIACGVTTALFGMGFYWDIHSLWYYIIVQATAGLVQATGAPPVLVCMGSWFGKKRRGLLMGVWNIHTNTGNLMGALIAGELLNRNWGLSFIVPAGIIAFFGIVTFIFLVPYQEDFGLKNLDYDEISKICDSSDDFDSKKIQPWSNEGTNEKSSLLKPDEKMHSAPPAVPISLFDAVKIPGVFEYSLCLFFTKLVAYTFMFWLPVYIGSLGFLSPSESADLSTMFDVGGVAGAIFLGLIIDHTGTTAIPISISMVISVPMLYLYFLFGSVNVWYNMGLLILVGYLVNGPYTMITALVAADLGTHESLSSNQKALAAVTGIVDGTGSLGAAAGPLLCGLLIPYGWDNAFYMMMLSSSFAALLLVRQMNKEVKHCVEHRKRRGLFKQVLYKI